MSEEAAPRLPNEERDKSLRGVLRRLFWKYALQTALGIAVLVGAATWSLVTGLAQAPANYRALRVEVDSLKSSYASMSRDLKDIATATWTFVALRCLELPDAAFVETRLPCGDALFRSGITRRLTKP